MNRKMVGLVVVIGLAGCQAGDPTADKFKRVLADTVGGVSGALLGHNACNDSNSSVQLLCTAAGTVVGSVVADVIYQKLTEADRKRMERETTEALAKDSAQSQPREWTNQETGVTATVKVKEETTERVTTEVPILKGPVQSPPPLQLVGQVYEVTASQLNIRGGPGTDYVTLGNPLPKGSLVDITARVESKPDWYLLSRDGAGAGYVFAQNLKPTGKAVESKPANANVEVAKVSVQAQRSCKVIEQSARYADGKADKASSRMCQQGDGSWVIVS